MQPIKTAFFSGTFNPVHTGHLILANYLCEYEGFDEIWLSVSPQNPLREKLPSNNDRQRIEMLNMACPARLIRFKHSKPSERDIPKGYLP